MRRQAYHSIHSQPCLLVSTAPRTLKISDMRGFENYIKVTAALLWALGAGSSGTVLAQGQTGAATVELTQPRYTIPPRAQTAHITLRRSGATNAAVSVDFATSDDTAVAGVH